MPNNKISPEPVVEHETWTIKQLQHSYRDPNLLIVDIRNSGNFRGGPPANPKAIPTQYHQGHLFLALNLNLEHCTTVKEVSSEIYHGMHSAGGSFIDTIIFAIVSGFNFLFYDQDGSNSGKLSLIKDVELKRDNKEYKFPSSQLHWLEGGFISIMKNSSLRKSCYDTKSLLGTEEEIDEPAYSQILPELFVGGAVCSNSQLKELKEAGVKHVINVSNMERNYEGFNCIFQCADDDQNEDLNRLFYSLANQIDSFIQEGEGVFVHCQRGLSRSPSIVMAYLMIQRHYSHRQAFEILKKKRPNIGPRSNFMIQLCKLEAELSEKGIALDKKKTPTLLIPNASLRTQFNALCKV